MEDFSALQGRAKTILAELNRGRGNPNLHQARAQSAAKSREKGDATARRVKPLIRALRKEGFTTYRAIAAELHKRLIPPPHGTTWQASSVRLIENRETN